MTDTLAQQLHELTELHTQGSLTDEEFAAAKGAALAPATSTPATGTPATGTPAEAEPAEVVYFRFTWPWILLCAVILTTLVQTILGAGLEWAPVMRPAAPVLCAGGQFEARFDVTYGVSEKGVNFVPTCTRDGETRELSTALVDLVLTVEYTIGFMALLYGLRALRRATRRTPLPWVAQEQGLPARGISISRG